MTLITIFARRAILLLFEQAVESRDARESGLQGDFCDGKAWLCEQLFRNSDSSIVDVIAECKVGVLFEQSGEMILTKANRVCHSFQSQIFHIMCVYVIQKFVEFLNVSLLLARFDIREDVGCVDMVMTELNKEVKEHGMDGKLFIFVLAKILICHA